jgi:hypothetical protein
MKQADKESMFVDMYEVITQLPDDKLKMLIKSINDIETMNDFEAYKLIYLAFIWSKDYIIIIEEMNGLVCIDCDCEHSIDFAEYGKPENNYDLKFLYTKYRLKSLIMIFNLSFN